MSPFTPISPGTSTTHLERLVTDVDRVRWEISYYDEREEGSRIYLRNNIWWRRYRVLLVRKDMGVGGHQGRFSLDRTGELNDVGYPVIVYTVFLFDNA